MKTHLLLVACACLLVSCTSEPDKKNEVALQETPPAVALGEDGVACVGATPAPPAGFALAHDEALLAEAMEPTDKGGLCAGQAWTATAPVRVWRVWDSSREHSRLGRWWALERPPGPREDYRQEYAICASWSALDRLVSCALIPGSTIAAGTTQSAACDDGATIPKNGALQLYIPNDGRQERYFVEDCRDEGAWPDAAQMP